MNSKVFLFFVFLPFFVSACSTTSERVVTTTVAVENREVKPEISIPPMPPLKPFKFDIPRDMTTIVPKNTEKCKAVPPEKRNEAYWLECGVYKPLENTNIFLGLDEENFNNLMYDLNVLRERILLLEEIIREINRQRRENNSKALNRQ